MDKKLVVLVLIFAIAVIGVIAIFYHSQQSEVPTSNVTRPPEDYLHFKDDGASKIYLINSSISYGTYERDSYWPPWEEMSARKGDPCVIISGTIRNDYKDQWVPLGAYLYNAKDERVGTTVTYSAKPWFEAVEVESNGTGIFEIRVKYNKKDVSCYDIYLWWEPTASPPP